MPKHRRSKSSRSHSTKNVWAIVNSCLIALFILLAGLTSYLLLANNILNVNGLNWIVIALFIGVTLLVIVLTATKKLQRLTCLILLVASVFVGVFLFATKSTIDATKRMNESSFYSEVEMSVVVNKDSAINNIKEVDKLLAPVDSDQENIQGLLTNIKSNEGIDLATEKVDSYQSAFDTISSDSNQAMVLNSGFVSLLEQPGESLKDRVKTIYTYTVRKETKTNPKTANADVFNIYVSGIDTYGPISSVSRSDVNIIMTVNLKTNKVLLTTTPRDSYVKIPDGGADQYDKLTHAGIYGVETSEKTLENLYGIPVDYYARINFTSFLKLIDLLGGVEVVNDQAFTSKHGNYDFPVGKVTLDSERALAFVRERYSLDGGDNDRGKNQEKVITAIINKMASLRTITNFSSVLNGLGDSIQTNMPTSTLMTIANKQVASGGRYTVESQDVKGTGSTGQLKSYAMPGSSLYMYSLDEASVSEAKAAIQSVMEGN